MTTTPEQQPMVGLGPGGAGARPAMSLQAFRCYVGQHEWGEHRQCLYCPAIESGSMTTTTDQQPRYKPGDHVTIRKAPGNTVWKVREVLPATAHQTIGYLLTTVSSIRSPRTVDEAAIEAYHEPAARPAQSAARLATAQRAFDALAELGEATYIQWDEACDMSRSSFQQARRDLIDSGRVEHIGRHYWPTDMGKEPAQP